MDEFDGSRDKLKALLTESFERGFRQCGELVLERLGDFKEHVEKTKPPPIVNPLQAGLAKRIKRSVLSSLEEAVKIATQVKQTEIVVLMVPTDSKQSN